ncbi:MAG: glycosyl hydrolase, partial [Cyclobacteriaceae bacterium]|nr:glycosyl hydrolase [Cyclobacteriaceae bacterium]
QMTRNWEHDDMWIDPTDGDHMAVAGDGGIAISYNHGKSWHRSQLPVAQLYHVTTDNSIPYNVYTNRQDGPSSVGPSRAFLDDFMEPGIPRGMWHGVGGGESGFATPDPTDANIVWSSASGSGGGGGIVVRYNEQKKQYRQVEVWPEATFGSPAKDVKYRFQWTFPLLISPHDHNTVYTTGNHVFRTTNGGQKWDVISPDLTTNDKSKQQISGGLTPDNIGVEYCCVIYAFDESPIQKGLLWAGTNDGLVHVSKDGGANWENLTANLKGLPPHGTVRNIDASKYKAGKAYLTVDFHQVGNFDTHVYKTEDFGKTWVKITNGVPKSNVSYACNVREDPVRPGLLYLGTESALYVSFDDGANWQSMMSNLPPSPMYWINIQENFNDMVIGTYGRGIWILDDISPYQQLTAEVAASAAHFFVPNKTYRLHPITAQYAPSDDPSVGVNPQYGAPLNYWLSADAKDSAVFEIRDASKNLVRTIKHKGKTGINRVYWDLREDPSDAFYVRTKPLFADWVNMGDSRKRLAPSLGRGITPLVRPGDYTITMKYDGKEQSQPIKVLKDPNTEGSEADIQAQYALIADIKKDINSAAAVVNKIEVIRRQLYDIKSLIGDEKGSEEVVKSIDATDAKLIEIEGNLIQLKITGDGQSSIRWSMQAVEKLGYLAYAAESVDFPPADQHKEVYQVLKARVADSQSKMNAFMEKEFPALMESLKKAGYSSPVILKK